MSEFKIRFWGTRGSAPAPGPRTQRYGGNTSCVELRSGSTVAILDAGTGIRELGDALIEESMGRPIQAHIFISHTHWDHIQGFPFFAPLYSQENSCRIYGPRGVGKSFEDVFRVILDPHFFPVNLEGLRAKLKFTELAGEPMSLGGLSILSSFTNHPGVDLAYRFASGGRSVTYLTDHETYQTMNAVSELTRKQDRMVEEFCRGSDLLICDGQYTDEEYRSRKAWGHSRYRDTVHLALAAGVGRLAVFHHEPSHDDPTLDGIEEDCRNIVARSGKTLDCFLARDGLRLEI